MINVNTLHQGRAKIVRMAKQRPLNPDLLIKAISDFVYFQRKVMETLQETAQGVMRNQKDVISAIWELSRSLDTTCRIVKQLSEKVETEEGRIRLSEISLQLAKLTVVMGAILEKVNSSNNGFWKFVVTGIIFVVGVSACIIFREPCIKNSENESSSHNSQC